MSIWTVRGPIDESDLGTCMTHEHVFFDAWPVWGDFNALLSDPEIMAAELSLFQQAGGTSIVDVTAPGVGRDPQGLLAISEATGINIVMAAGYYLPNFYPEPRSFERSSATELGQAIAREFEDGVAATGVRPGVIKVAVQHAHISPTEERALRAVSRAHKLVGAPITTHAEMYAGLGLKQLAIFEEEGVRPNRIIIGHCGTVMDLSYHRAIVERGAYAQFDTVGRNDILPDSIVAARVKELIDLGFLDRILLSSDICRRSHLATFGGHGFGYLLNEFVPMLEKNGVTEGEIEAILSANPAKVLSF